MKEVLSIQRSQNVCYGACEEAQRKGVETIEVAQNCLIHVMKWKEE